jgi:predicted nucleic acid-binding Zn ribbon protein
MNISIRLSLLVLVLLFGITPIYVYHCEVEGEWIDSIYGDIHPISGSVDVSVGEWVDMPTSSYFSAGCGKFGDIVVVQIHDTDGLMRRLTEL